MLDKFCSVFVFIRSPINARLVLSVVSYWYNLTEEEMKDQKRNQQEDRSSKTRD